MSNVSKFELNGITIDVKDAVARSDSSEIDTELDALSGDYQQFKSKANSEIDALEQRADNVDRVLAGTSESIGTLSEDNNRNKSEINSLKNRTTANENDITRLTNQVDGNTENISQLSDGLDVVENSAENLQEAMTVLSERMDTFTQLPAGSTSGDAELQDIRVGADGVTYATAGVAVRSQFLKAFSQISASGITDANLFDRVGYAYLSANNVNNLPGAGAWYLCNIKLNNSNMLQMAFTARATSMYVRASVNNSWSAWLKVTNDFTKALSTDYTNANDMTQIGYLYASSNNISNLPKDGVFHLFVLALDSNNLVQVAYETQLNGIYYRVRNIGSWSSWVSAGFKQFYNSQALTNANDFNETGYIYTSSSLAENLPTDGAWYLMNFIFNSANSLQIAVPARGGLPYIRAKVINEWGDWNVVGGNNGGGGSGYVPSSSIAMFETVGCCGDSFTAGYLYNKPDSQWYDPSYVPNGEYPKIGYPAVMGRLYGVSVTPYAQGGVTSGDFRTNNRCLPALRADTPKDLYIIALGLNDYTQNIPLGSASDINTEPANETYLGNMGAIIRAIKSHAPACKIILCKSLWVYNAGSTSPNAYYNYISSGVEILSQTLGIPYIETLNDAFFACSEYVNGLKGLHPTAALYAGIGKRIGELTGEVILNNPSYFYNYYKD